MIVWDTIIFVEVDGIPSYGYGPWSRLYKYLFTTHDQKTTMTRIFLMLEERDKLIANSIIEQLRMYQSDQITAEERQSAALCFRWAIWIFYSKRYHPPVEYPHSPKASCVHSKPKPK